MAFKPGHKKVGGRTKGSVNKRTDLFAICADVGIDVMKEMITLAAHTIDPDARFSKLRDIAPYLYARKKEVVNIEDHSVEDLLQTAEKKLKEPESVV